MKYLTTEEFKENIMDYTQKDPLFKAKKPTIIKFTGEWCLPCQRMNPVLEEIEREYEGKLDIFNVDVDSEYEPAAAFGVRSIPNMIFIPLEGQPERMMGALPKKALEDAIHRVLKL